MNSYDTSLCSDLSKEVRRRTEQLEKHVQQLRKEAEPRAKVHSRVALAVIAKRQRTEDHARLQRMERWVEALYSLEVSLSQAR